MDVTSSYVVRELAKDSCAWRIDWFGAVTYAERHRRPSQPLIEVQISQVPNDLGHFSEFFQLREQQWPSTRRLRLPVGFLPMLRIGDIWRDGRRSESPDYEIANFAHLNVSRDCSTLIKAGLPNEATGEYYLPLDIHPYHMSFTQSYCVHIEHEGCSIVIPCAELLRFYFGSSSTLVSRIFDAPLKQELLWAGQPEIDINGLAKIELARGISGRSATDIGRIAFSKTGRAAAELVGNSCIAATSRGEAAYLKAAFPFTGETHLSASGIWINRDDGERRIYLVFRLRSCSHQFPFSRLQYTSERAQAQSVKSSPPAAGPKSLSPTFSNRRQDPKILSDVEPSRSKQARRLGMYFGDMQFPDLARKSISRIDSEDAPTVQLSKQGLSIIESASVGGEGSEKSIQPIELSAFDATSLLSSGTSTEAKSRQVRLLLQVLQHVSQLPLVLSVDVVRLSPRQRFDYLSTMPQIVDENGELSASCLITEGVADAPGKLSTRNRQVSIGRAVELHRTHYFLVPEPDDDTAVELHIIQDSSRSIRTTADLLAAIAVHFATPPAAGRELTLMAGVNSIRLSTDVDIDRRVKMMIEKFLSSAGKFAEPSAKGTMPFGEASAEVHVPDYLR